MRTNLCRLAQSKWREGAIPRGYANDWGQSLGTFSLQVRQRFICIASADRLETKDFQREA